MKNLLLLLLLANILYFLWGMFVQEAPQPGVAFIEEAELGPSLEIAGFRRADGGARLPCATLGPFRELEEANRINANFAEREMAARVRVTDAEVFVGHWVQIRDVSDDATAEEMLGQLSRGGMKEAYLVRTEDEGLKISIGLFQEQDRAEKVEQDVRSLDLPAEIGPRMAERTVYFVDIELPDGQSTGSIVDEFGGEQVSLKSAATCP